MADEVWKVCIESPNKTEIPAEFLVWEEDPENNELVRLSLKFQGSEITRSDNDYFSAMCSIRRELEKEGLLLRCYGASRNVYPSPMSRDMGGAYKAERLYSGSPSRLEDVVCIFDVGSDVSPASVDEQERFYREWLQSIGIIK